MRDGRSAGLRHGRKHLSIEGVWTYITVGSLMLYVSCYQVAACRYCIRHASYNKCCTAHGIQTCTVL